MITFEIIIYWCQYEMIMLNSYVAFDFPAEIETFTSLFKETGLTDFITMGGDGSTAMGKTMLAND